MRKILYIIVLMTIVALPSTVFSETQKEVSEQNIYQLCIDKIRQDDQTPLTRENVVNCVQRQVIAINLLLETMKSIKALPDGKIKTMCMKIVVNCVNENKINGRDDIEGQFNCVADGIQTLTEMIHDTLKQSKSDEI